MTLSGLYVCAKIAETLTMTVVVIEVIKAMLAGSTDVRRGVGHPTCLVTAALQDKTAETLRIISEDDRDLVNNEIVVHREEINVEMKLLGSSQLEGGL